MTRFERMMFGVLLGTRTPGTLVVVLVLLPVVAVVVLSMWIARGLIWCLKHGLAEKE